MGFEPMPAPTRDILWLRGRGILKGRVHCFSMQVGMNKCFLNPEKKMAQIRHVVFEKNVKTYF